MYLILKMITGEELIGTTESDSNDDDVINLENVYSIIYQMSRDGNIDVKYMPYILSSDEKLFTFTQKHIIHTSIPSNKYIKLYDDMVQYDAESTRQDDYPQKTPSIH